MNKIEWQQNQISENFTGCKNLGQMIAKAEENLKANGQIACRFFVNDIYLNEVDEKKYSDTDINDIKKFAVEAEAPAYLLFGVLDNWIKELPQIIKKCDNLSSDIKFNGIEGHLKSFVDTVDVTQFLVESLMSLQNVIESGYFTTPKWHENELLTAKAIGEAIAAFEKKDFVQLAEIIEYDLAHAMTVWLELLTDMSQSLRQANEKDAKEFNDRIFKKENRTTP